MRRWSVAILSMAMFVLVFGLFASQSAATLHAQQPIAQRATPTRFAPALDPTLQAGAMGDFPQGSRVFGPDSGSWQHEPETGTVKTTEANVAIANFVVEATFSNPYDADAFAWSHGFIFREISSQQYRLIIASNGAWELITVTNSEFITLQSGTLTGLNTKKGEENTLRLAAVDGDGLFSLNGEIIASLDLLANWGLGDISAGTGFYIDNEIAGSRTEYRDFTIWSIGPLPTLTPTATPQAISELAVLGNNRGEIALGGGETWRFEGRAGQTLVIRANADRPAGREATTEERIELNLLDTYLTLRAPDGSVLAENDDNEALADDNINITNSLIEITLPADGIYEIEVRSYDNATGGSYVLAISERRQLVPVAPTPTQAGV